MDVVTDGACEGEKIITRTWSLVDNCGNAAADQVQVITLKDNTPPVITLPGDLTMYCFDATLVDDWAANALATDNCDPDPELDYDYILPVINCDQTITVTFTAVDNCGNESTATMDIYIVTPDFTMVPDDGEIINCASELYTPANPTVYDYCGNEITNVTGPVISETPECEGEVTYVWTYTDCSGKWSHDWTYTFNVDPIAITFMPPSGKTVYGCDFDDMAALQDDFDAWFINENSNLVSSVMGGCNPSITHDWTGPFTILPCDGGSIPITWTITDPCATFTTTAIYVITPAPALSYNDPENGSGLACDLTDPASLQAAFDGWVAEQYNTIGLGGGCNPSITDDSDGVIFNEDHLCEGDAVTVTWTITDKCESAQLSATFTVIAPDPLSVALVDNQSVHACDFDNDDPALAQEALEAAFMAWYNTNNDAVNAVTGGCAPVVVNDYDGALPDLCNTGSITVNWTVTDICETVTRAATFDWTQPDKVVLGYPDKKVVSACDYADQQALDLAFNTWVSKFTVSGGCSPEGDYGNPTAPLLCVGGTVTVTYTWTDICESGSKTRTFTVMPTPALVYSEPEDGSALACDLPDLGSLQAAFDNWVVAQYATIGLSGGCNPSITDDSDGVIFNEDYLCTGTTAMVTWTIYDKCEDVQLSAVFTVDAPDPLNVSVVEDLSVHACDFDNDDPELAQYAIEEAFITWFNTNNAAVNGVTGGCSPIVENDYIGQLPTLCTSGAITVVWTVTDVCETVTRTATFDWTEPDKIILGYPDKKVVSACDFADQQALDLAFNTWVSKFTVSGGCSPEGDYGNPTAPLLCVGGTVTVTYTWTDICESGSKTRSFIVTPYEDFTVPDDVTDPITFASDATVPEPPQVFDYCGNELIPGNPVVGGTYESCEGTITYTFTYEDCAGHSHDWVYTYVVGNPDLICSIDPFPFNQPDCGTSDNNQLTATIDGGTGSGTYSYYWTIDANAIAAGWEIVDGTEDEEVVKFAASDVQALFTLTVTDANGCTTTCEMTVNSCEEVVTHFCTYTKGFYGSAGGLSCSGNTPKDIMLQAIMASGGSFTFGLPDHSFTLLQSDIEDGYVFKMLPGGGNSVAIGKYDVFYLPLYNPGWSYVPINSKGAIKNNLLAQTMALYFNMGWNTGANNGGLSLGELELEGTKLITADGIECATQIAPIPGYQVTLIPQGILMLLCEMYPEGPTVNDLFTLANMLLGAEIPEQYVGNYNKLYGEAVAAVTAINEAFDECRVFIGFEDLINCNGDNLTYGPATGTNELNTADFNIEAEIVPNPFEYQTEIRFKLSHKSNVSIEIYDMQGNLVQETYEGIAEANEQQIVKCNILGVASARYLMCVIKTSHGTITKPMLIKTQY